MIRDYSDAQKQNLLAMVQQVQPNGRWETLKDWFGDGGLSIYKYLGGLNVNNYLHNMDVYHLAMIDKDDVSAQQINDIFDEVKRVDRIDKLRFDVCGNLLGNLTNLITQYAKAATSKGIKFCDPADLTAIETSADYSAYQSNFVTVFEMTHPDIKADMDKAFADMKNGANYYDDKGNPTWHPGVPDEVNNIKFIVYSAEEPYRSLFTDNVGNVKICPENGGSFYTTNGGKSEIHINWNNPQKMSGDTRGPYAGFFHEFGHYLDDIYKEGAGKSITDEFETSGGIKLQESIDKDVQKVVEKKIREMYPSFTDAEVDDVLKRLTKGNLPGYVDNDPSKIVDAAKKVQDKIYKDISDPKANGIADVYDSSTNYLRAESDAPIPTQYESTNTGKGVSGGWQHGNDYYYTYTTTTNPDGTQSITIGNQTTQSGAKEGFATYYSQNMLGWTDYSSYYTEYLPGTTGYYGEIIDYMVDN